MATPSVEFEVQRLPQYGTPFVTETWGRSNIVETTEPFQLTEGRYAIRAKGSSYSAIVLETVPGGLPVASFGADGADIVELPTGSYRVTVQ